MQAPEIFHARPRQLTRAEYHRMIELGIFHEDERVELMHGMLVRMSPIGPPHSEVVARLTAWLIPALASRASVRPQSPYIADDDSEPEPDVTVVPRQSYMTGHPERAFLVIEVADSSLDYDRETKAPLYAASNVDEYWIVDLRSRAIEIYSAPANGKYGSVRRAAGADRIAPAAFPDVSITVTELVD